MIGQRYLTAFAVVSLLDTRQTFARLAMETNFNSWPKKFEPSLCNAKLARWSFLR